MFKTHNIKSRLVSSASIATVLLSALSTSAIAQDAPAEDEIIVTGSRIPIDPNLTSPVPVQSLTADDFRLSGEISLADVVNDVPALVSSTTAENSLTGANALNLRGLGTDRTLTLVNGRRHVAGFAGDQAVDIGSIPQALVERVEVLTGGASAIYGADAVTGVVNFILKDDYEGLDLDIRGGVSDQGDAENFSVRGLYGKNFDNDRGNFTIAVDYIDDSELLHGDREFSRDNGIENDDVNPATATDPNAFPRIFLPGHTFSISSERGVIGPGDFSGFGTATSGLDLNGNGIDDCQDSSVGQNSSGGFGGCFVIDNDGTVRPYQDGLIAGAFNQFGGDGVRDNYNGDTLLPSIDTFTINLNSSYDITPTTEVFFEAKYSESTATVRNELDAFFDLLTVTPENPFIPSALQNLADTRGGLVVTRDPTDLGDTPTINERETIRLVGGIKGEFARNLNFELSANYGQFENVQIADTLLLDRFFAAIDVVQGPNGPICRSDIDSTTVAPGTRFNAFPTFDNGFFTFTPGDGQCQPLNILAGQNSASPEAAEFVNVLTEDKTELEQFVLSALVYGDSAEYFTLPAGPVGFAAGIEYRREESQTTNNPFELGIIPSGSPLPAGGFIGDFSDNNGLGFNGGEARQFNSGGEYDVTDLFGEIRVPLVTDKEFFEDLSIDAAIRFADYSTLGLATTWKLGTSWTVNDSLSFRGTVSEAIRAPNIFELFAPQNPQTFRPIDPCDFRNIPSAPNPSLRAANCAADGIPADFVDPLTARFVGTQGGNPDLGVEIADTLTIGGVFSPSFLPGVSLTVDYWSVDISNTIASVPIQDVVDNCYDLPTFPNSFCGQFTRERDASSPLFLGFNNATVSEVNFARAEAEGIDFAFRASRDFGENNIGLSVVGTRQLALDNFFDPNDLSLADPELGEIQRPKWSGNATLSWNRGPFAASVQGTYQSTQTLAGAEIETVDNIFGPNGFSGDITIFDANASYEFNDNFSFYGGVNNFTDETPFRTQTAFPVGPRGRFLFGGVRITY